ncbi:MAG: helix-turn-helix domain-containing protein [Alphaproteobacteria bacterium]|nr:helix-turn-helix domain-containing protein [Alphaproteobacteria bacterium]
MQTIDKSTFRDLLRSAGRSQKDLADHLGVNPSAISRLISGERRLTAEEAQKMAQYLNISLSKILGVFHGNIAPLHGRTFSVLNYVGAGGKVYPIDDYEPGTGMYEVELPPNLEPETDWIALQVRGDSMYPQMEDGWLVWYRRQTDGVNPDSLNRISVVKLTEDGSVMVKRLRPGRQPGLYDLESVNAPPIRDAELEWAEPIAAIQPR